MTKTTEVRTSRIRLRRATIALAALTAFGLGVVATTSAGAQSLSVLHSFAGPDGAIPYSTLIMDKAGNLYGTTSGGTVFKLDASGNVTVLHRFTGSPGDGASPFAGLIMDKAGNLYGTTAAGGAGTCNLLGPPGCGTVFKLDTSSNETVLHSFAGYPTDGANPIGALIMDKAGNLYGTTPFGGAGTCNVVAPGCGTVFKLDTSGNETVLHSFTGGDGANPYYGALIMDTAGNLYGTTLSGGASGGGTVFKLDASGNETVLHSFPGYPGDGESLWGGLIMDATGNLYGVTVGGGASSNCFGGCGTVFRLDTSGNETVLHSFTGGDGAFPEAALIMDKGGNLYGTTYFGGTGTCSGFSVPGCGTVFRLDTSGSEWVLHSFRGPEGANPGAGLLMDQAGYLYGATEAGGAFGLGTVFKLAVPSRSNRPRPSSSP
jgi:uncharacterized repeat protein (TIGR03803 family)